MKKLFSLIVVFVLASCANSQEREIKINANEWNFSKYDNSVVDHITYCDGCGTSGDILTISFKDGMTLQIYAYKYNMKVVL